MPESPIALFQNYQHRRDQKSRSILGYTPDQIQRMQQDRHLGPDIQAQQRWHQSNSESRKASGQEPSDWKQVYKDKYSDRSIEDYAAARYASDRGIPSESKPMHQRVRARLASYFSKGVEMLISSAPDPDKRDEMVDKAMQPFMDAAAPLLMGPATAAGMEAHGGTSVEGQSFTDNAKTTGGIIKDFWGELSKPPSEEHKQRQSENVSRRRREEEELLRELQ